MKDSPKRAEAFKMMAKEQGCTVKEMLWTLGTYDVVTIIEAPDEMAATSLGLAIGKQGNIRTQTMRAFSAAEMAAILAKAG